MRAAVFLLAAALAPTFAAQFESEIPRLPDAPVLAPVGAAPPAMTAAPQVEIPGGLDAAAAPGVLPAATLQAAGKTAVPAKALSATAQLAASAAPARSDSAAPNPAVFAAAADGGRPLDIMVVAAEAVPFAKTGGLADVVDAVNRGLAARGHRVTLVMPAYKNLKRDGLDFKPHARISVPLGDRTETATVLRAERQGVEIWLLDGALFNSRDGPYADNGKFHADNDDRFITLSRGALEAAKADGRKPDIVHSHDWHSALIGPMIKKVYAGDPAFANTRSVLTVHNLAYQGAFAAETILKAGFSLDELRWDSMEHWGQFNFMKAGLQHSDALTTVSPTYAREIQTPKFGLGFEGLLQYRAAGLHGILNGVDKALWSPQTDPAVVRQYGAQDAWEGKRENKTAVQMLAGFETDPNAPLFAVASRFDQQKGIDLVLKAIPDIIRMGGQLVISGSGDPELEKLVAAAAAEHPGHVFRHPFSEVFVHALYAAADFLLMPSRFEPCGLSQLISHLYGTLPIATRTGGLADTIVDGEDGLFISDFTPEAMAAALSRAKARYDDPAELQRMRRVAMAKDTSWDGAVAQYEALFRRLLGR